MGNFDLLPARLRSSSIAEPVERLDDIYRKIDVSQRTWMAKTPYRCPDGCGSCCDNFEPDILDVEAWYLAAWIGKHAPDRLNQIARNRNRAGCVLADPDNPHHCTVYGGRPLICRLFAYSGDRGKTGRPRFMLCKSMPSSGPRQLEEDVLLERYGLTPPIMADFAQEATTLAPGDAGDRKPLREALAAAANKLRYLFELSADAVILEFALDHAENDGDNDDDNDNPGGSTPPLSEAV